VFNVSEVNSGEQILFSVINIKLTVQWYPSFSFRSPVSKRDSGRLQGLRKHGSRSRFWEHQNMDREVTMLHY